MTLVQQSLHHNAGYAQLWRAVERASDARLLHDQQSPRSSMRSLAIAEQPVEPVIAAVAAQASAMRAHRHHQPDARGGDCDRRPDGCQVARRPRVPGLQVGGRAHEEPGVAVATGHPGQRAHTCQCERPQCLASLHQPKHSWHMVPVCSSGTCGWRWSVAASAPNAIGRARYTRRISRGGGSATRRTVVAEAGPEHHVAALALQATRRHHGDQA